MEKAGQITEKPDHIFDNRAILGLLLPLMVEQLLNSLMGTVDTIMISNVGEAAMSAVSLVDSLNVLFLQAFSALAAGGCIVCSQFIGKKDQEEANRAARQVLLVMVVVSLTVMVFCLLGNRRLLKLIFGSVEQDVMDAAVTYFFYTALSLPCMAVYNAGASVYRAQGNSRRPMMISMTSNFLNIGGNAFFIWVLHIGVTGVALATLMSRAFCAVAVMWFLRRPGQLLVIDHYLQIRPDRRLILKVLAIGIPSGIENSMFQFGKLAIQSTVSTMGTTAIAAQAMTNIMESLNGVAGQGVGIGLMTITGQCIGAGRKDEAVYYVKKLMAIAECFLTLNCLIVYGLAGPITRLAAMEPDSAALCLHMVGWITIMKPILWVGSFIPIHGLRAAGDVKFTMLVSSLSMWICRVSLCIFLVRAFSFGPMAVWIGMFTDWGMRGLIYGLRFHSRKWLEHSVIS